MEQKWATIEKEAYAVIYALQKLRTYLWGSDFTIYTDHKLLKSLFLQEVQNTRIQRWAVLKAEFGADIKYRPGKCHVRADMLSRIRPGNEIATFDTKEFIHPDGFLDDHCDMRIPLEADNLDKDLIQKGQRKEFPAALQEALHPSTEEDSHYIVSKVLLYSLKPVSPIAAQYPLLVLPKAVRDKVIERCHKEMGHQAIQKTMERLRDSYVWPGMRKEKFGG